MRLFSVFAGRSHAVAADEERGLHTWYRSYAHLFASPRAEAPARPPRAMAGSEAQRAG